MEVVRRLSFDEVSSWKRKLSGQKRSLSDFELLNMSDIILKRSLRYYDLEIEHIFDAQGGDVAAIELLRDAKKAYLNDVSMLLFRNFN